jgi:parallel beta-helix repeat protein
MRRLLSVLVFVILVAVPSQGRVLVVDDDGPADFRTIQAAIDDANDADVILVRPGRYIGPGNRDVDFNGKRITAHSADPNDGSVVASTIVDCKGSESDPHRGFYFHGGEDANSILEGLTITNGYIAAFEGFGGGIACTGSSPTIRRCVISRNTVPNGSGGGIYCGMNSAPTIEQCTISENIASLYGGGIFAGSCSKAGPTIKDCSMTANSAGFEGGGVFSSCEQLVITGSDVSFNKGGGILCDWGSGTTITACTFKGNLPFSNNLGGGIVCRGTAVVEHSEIIANTARSDWFRGSSGGGITCSAGNVTMTNCLTIGNRSTSGPGRFGEITEGNGGGICAEAGSITATNCTIADNIADVRGGAIFCGSANITLENCIVWNNDPDEIAGPTVVAAFSDIRTAWPGVGNINADPLFAQVGYWELNNTPQDVNDDLWIDGDYHLKSQAGRWHEATQTWIRDSVTSPCIDGGNPGWPAADESQPNGDRLNMGAYGGTAQASLSPIGWRTIADLTNDMKADLRDLDVLVSYWLQTGEFLPADLDRNGTVDLYDLAILAEHWLP